MTSPRTLLGPLTTTWTRPAVCSYAMALGCSTCSTGFQGQTCNVASNAHDWTDCWPPRATSMSDPGVMMGWGFYSPGIACPDGYTTAAMATAGGSTGWGLEYSLTSGETAAACCPSGFTPSSIDVTNTYAATCAAVVTSSSFSTVVCNSGVLTGFSDVTVPNDDMKSFTVYAPLFQLNFQASDIPAVTTSAAQSQSTTTNPASPSSSASNAASTSAAAAGNTPDGGGLQTGAKIGIGVGVGVGAIILLAIALLIWRARRKSKAGAAAAAAAADDDEKGTAVGSTPGRKKSERAEMGGDDVLELGGKKVEPYSAPPQELGATGLSIGEPRQPVAIFELAADNPDTLHIPPPTIRQSLDDTHSSISPATPTRPDHGHLVSPTTPTRPEHQNDGA